MESIDDKSKVCLFLKHEPQVDLKQYVEKNQVIRISPLEAYALVEKPGKTILLEGISMKIPSTSVTPDTSRYGSPRIDMNSTLSRNI